MDTRFITGGYLSKKKYIQFTTGTCSKILSPNYEITSVLDSRRNGQRFYDAPWRPLTAPLGVYYEALRPTTATARYGLGYSFYYDLLQVLASTSPVTSTGTGGRHEASGFF